MPSQNNKESEYEVDDSPPTILYEFKKLIQQKIDKGRENFTHTLNPETEKKNAFL